MKIMIAICAALAMSACAQLPGSGAAGELILKDLQGCQRDYEGAIGAGFTGSVKIHCAPQIAAGTTIQTPAAPSN